MSKKKVVRKAKSKAKRKTVTATTSKLKQVSLRLSPTQHAKLVKAVERKGLKSINSFILMVLKEKKAA